MAQITMARGSGEMNWLRCYECRVGSEGGVDFFEPFKQRRGRAALVLSEPYLISMIETCPGPVPPCSCCRVIRADVILHFAGGDDLQKHLGNTLETPCTPCGGVSEKAMV